MDEKQKSPSKPKIIKWITNKYVLVFLFFLVWMLFLDNYSYLDHRVLNKQINELEDNKTYYQQEINKDKKSINELKNPENIEKYAREKYFMKKDSEDIYIIEFEGDSIKK
jgi:cell division protein DivIC